MLKNFSVEEFDIVLQAGQSNSDGTGFGFVQKPYVVKDIVWYLNNDFTISPACETVNGNSIQSNYSLTFADKYINSGMLKAGRKLLIIRAAVGGTGFLDNRWGLEDDLFTRMIEMVKTALELNKNNRLVAFLWHQGETDADLGASYEQHLKNLSTIVSAVREGFECLDLPFVAGDFAKQWKDENILNCEPVIDAIKAVCDGENCKFVITDELKSNSQTYDCDDTIHFSRESLYILGEKYFNAFKYIKETTIK